MVFTHFLAIQYISVSNGNPFILLFIFHYTRFTVSAFTMACLTIERVIVTFKPLLSIKLKEKKNYFIFCMFGIVIVSICRHLQCSGQMKIVAQKESLIAQPMSNIAPYSINGTYAIVASICLIELLFHLFWAA